MPSTPRRARRMVMPLFNSLGRLLPVAGNTSLRKLYCELPCIRPFTANVKLPSLLEKWGAPSVKSVWTFSASLTRSSSEAISLTRRASRILAFSSISFRIAAKSTPSVGSTALSTPPSAVPDFLSTATTGALEAALSVVLAGMSSLTKEPMCTRPGPGFA